MKIDVGESIQGLWMASGDVGYLETWFPRLRTGSARLIPMSPGINVFYGRNGAGKTQMLEAIAYAAEFKMSAHEGFILKNPLVSEIQPDFYAQNAVFDISPEDLVARWIATRTEEMMLGWTNGFDPEGIDHTNKDTVFGILKEFLSIRNALLTRSPSQEEPDASDPNRMNSPEFVQIVPTVLPSDSAPLTRRHANEIHASYLEFIDEIEAKFPGGDDPELTVDENNQIYSAEMDEKGKLFEAWIEEWSWSPLINLRNLGWDGNDYSFVTNGGECNLWDNETMPLYLPAISYDHRREYSEFQGTVKPRVSLSLTRESPIPGSPSFYDRSASFDELSDIGHGDIGYRNLKGDSEEIDQPEIYQQLLEDYLSRLRSKLKFLPNFRSLEYQGSSSRKNPYLVMNRNVLASRGSAAERRWLNLARKTELGVTQWVVIDEPEAGLHRAAEAELATTLSSGTWIQGSVVVVATHSPEFLDLPKAHVLHIDDGRVRELTSVDREELIVLGLRPGDLLTQVRAFLLVEGEHERIIFENLFSEELRIAGCKIIVARGGKNMKDIFESQMIFHFSDATVMSLLDNINSSEVKSIWGEAKELANRGKLIESGQYIRSSLPGAKKGENVFLSQFLTLALANGQYERVEVCGLSKADIVLYFEPACFGIKRTWEELLSAHTSSDPSFKLWASKKYGADFSIEAIDRASKSMGMIPDEFGELIRRISELSRRP